MLIFRGEPALIPLVRFESTKHKRGVNCVLTILQNSRKQPVNLFGQAVLDTTVSKKFGGIMNT